MNSFPVGFLIGAFAGYWIGALVTMLWIRRDVREIIDDHIGEQGRTG